MITDTKEKNRMVEILERVKWNQVGICMIAFFFARVIMLKQFYTLGICYLASVYFTSNMRKWTLVFTTLGFISTGIVSLEMLKYTSIIVFFVLMRGYQIITLKKLTLQNQACLTGVAIFLGNIVLYIVKGISIFGVLVTLLESTVGVGLVIVLSYGIKVIYARKVTTLTHNEIVSLGFLLACILGGMVDFYIQIPFFQAIYLRDSITFILLLGVAYLGGTNIGLTMGILISTILVIIGYMPSHFVAIYAIAIFIGAQFSKVDKVGSILAVGVGLLLGFALFNQRMIDRSILGSYLVAAMISALIPENYFGLAQWFDYEELLDDHEHLQRIQMVVTDKLKHFSKAFDQLSMTFNKIADKRVLLNQDDVAYIIEETGEKMCKNCSMSTFCWEDYLLDTYESAYEMLATTERNGQLTVGDIPEKFKKSCMHAESFAYTLSFKFDLFRQNLFWKNRFSESRELVAQQFEAVSTSINHLCEDIESELSFDKEEETQLKDALRFYGIKVKDVIIIRSKGRKQEIRIYTRYYKQQESLIENMKEAIEKTLAVSMDLQKVEIDEGLTQCYFKFCLSKPYNILAGACTKARNVISGDVYTFMEIEEGQYLLALADGMGSGKLALDESTTTIELLENFINSRFQNELAVKIINSVLVLKSDIENFSTMDIIIIDQYTGIAEFMKLGAATTFILRDGEIETIKSNTLPIGILKEVDMEVHHKKLKDGDVIIMVTDGMLESENDLLGKEDTFKQFILEADSHNPTYMAEYLMKKCCDLLGSSEGDDKTIIVARVWGKYE